MKKNRKHLKYDPKIKRWIVDYGGRRNRRRKFFENRNEAAEFMRSDEFLVAIGYKLPTPQSAEDKIAASIEEAVHWYCETISPTKSSFSQKWEPKRLREWSQRYQGQDLREIGLRQLFEDRGNWLSKKGYEPETVNRRITLLKSFFRACKQAGFIKVNPALELKKLQVAEPSQTETISELDQVRLLKAAKPWVRNPLWFAMRSGARRGEIVNLRWSAVDLKSGYLIIESNKGFHTKNKRSRRLPLTAQMQEALEALHRAAQAKGKDGSGDCVFLTSTGRRILPDRLTREAKKLMKRVLKKNQGAVHILRHGALTLMLQNGADIETVRRVAGHSSLNVTQRYLRSTDAAMRHAMSALDKSHILGKNVAVGGSEGQIE